MSFYSRAESGPHESLMERDTACRHATLPVVGRVMSPAIGEVGASWNADNLRNTERNKIELKNY